MAPLLCWYGCIRRNENLRLIMRKININRKLAHHILLHVWMSQTQPRHLVVFYICSNRESPSVSCCSYHMKPNPLAVDKPSQTLAEH